jgi:hypothetical protein
MKRWSIGIVGFAALILSGCASHTDTSSLIPSVVGPGGSTASGSNDTAIGTHRLVDLSSFFPHVHRKHPNLPALPANDPLASSIKTVEIDAYLYASYVSTDDFYREVKVAVPKGGLDSVSVKFPDAPVGNNEFALFEVDGYTAGGAEYFLGDVGAIVNVTKAGGIDIVANNQTSLVYQAEMAMIISGLFTANDLKSPALLATVENRVKTEKLKPDPTTGLLSGATLVKFVQQWAPAWRRTVTLVTGPNVDRVTYTNDATDKAENVLLYNETDFLLEDFYAERPGGAPCQSDFEQSGGLGTKPRFVTEACTANYSETALNTVANYVYGGPIIVGQVNDQTIPYQGTLTHIAARPPKSTRNLGSIPLRPAEVKIKTSDPLDWAAEASPVLYESFQPPTAPLIFPGYSDFQYSSSGWSKAAPGLAVLSWNPAGLPLSDYQVCTWRQTCIALNSTKTLKIDPPFSAPESDFDYWNFVGSSGVAQTGEPTAGCAATYGEHVTYSGSSFSLTTTQRTWLTAADELYFRFLGGCSVDPTGMTVTVTAQGADGGTYVNSAVSDGAGDEILVTMTSILHDTNMTSLTISVSGAPPNALDFDSIINYASP